MVPTVVGVEGGAVRKVAVDLDAGHAAWQDRRRRHLQSVVGWVRVVGLGERVRGHVIEASEALELCPRHDDLRHVRAVALGPTDADRDRGKQGDRQGHHAERGRHNSCHVRYASHESPPSGTDMIDMTPSIPRSCSSAGIGRLAVTRSDGPTRLGRARSGVDWSVAGRLVGGVGGVRAARGDVGAVYGQADAGGWARSSCLGRRGRVRRGVAAASVGVRTRRRAGLPRASRGRGAGSAGGRG